VGFSHLLACVRNRVRVELVPALLMGPPHSGRQPTYDLRRVQRKGLIFQLPRSLRDSSSGWADEWPCSLRRRTAARWTLAWGGRTMPWPADLPRRSPLALACDTWIGLSTTSLPNR
jgi:hypothetical protein